MILTEPGFYENLPMDLYVADPAPEPSLSTSTAHTLLFRSPLHAHFEHPRLGGHPSPPSSRGELGSAVHAMLLGGERVVYAPDEFEDWRKKDAQAFRDEARAAGHIPLLSRQREHVAAAWQSAADALSQFGRGRTETTLLWKLQDAWCRGRSDFLDDAGHYDIDVKTVSSADARNWVRTCVQSQGLDIQAGLRSLGHKVLGRERKMVWLLVEIEPPFACSFVGLGPSMIALAERKVLWAATVWRACLNTGKWPGYSHEIMWADMQTYAENEFSERTGVVPS